MKRRAPQGLKVLGRRASVATGRWTAGLRLAPGFLLAGVQRGGTTSLFRALVDHPAVLPANFHKGVNYFDVHYARGWDWYQGHFPLRAAAALRTRGAGEPVTFDASGYYAYHPHAAERIGRDLPGTKVLVMLRDPVERAWSAYKHEHARGFETEAPERAFALEDERVQPELERMLADPAYYSASHRHHSYRRRGQYAEQLERLHAAVGAADVLVVDSRDFFERPEEEYRRVTDFLGLAPHAPARFDRWNARPGSGMPEGVRRDLERALEPHDRALESLLGAPPSWRR
ncbi:sulfotransferase [Vallicoccus soli]|uniref:Sulfotransferase n=1 Tax=Vallicoccus soli TaxID=2339232 RepID=A0A3A3Z4M2_9ACTN|nr:sulfotransferase [Vallicoccus soli]